MLAYKLQSPVLSLFFAGTFLSRNPLYDDDDEGTKKEEERIPKPSLSCSVKYLLRLRRGFFVRWIAFFHLRRRSFFFCVWRWVPDVEVNSSCMRGADKLSRPLHEDGVRGVEPEGRRGAAEAAGERRRRGRLPPGPPRAEGRRLGPGARRLPGQERRGPAVGSAIAGRRHGNARVGGGAQAQAEGGGTARCVETGVVWYTAPWIGNLVFVCKLEASTADLGCRVPVRFCLCAGSSTANLLQALEDYLPALLGLVKEGEEQLK